MNPTVIGISAGCSEGERKGRAGVADAGIKDSVRRVRITRGRTVIVARPRPSDGITNRDRNRVGSEPRPALSDSHAGRSRRNDNRNQRQEDERKAQEYSRGPSA